MGILNNLKNKLKPLFRTFYLEITLQIKKFIIFLIITILLVIFTSFIVYLLGLFPDLPGFLARFYWNGTSYLIIISLLAVSFFFSGLICSEFKSNTGLTILPLINRYKFLIGKFIANLIFVIGIIGVYYITIALIGYYFYGGVIITSLFISFGFAILFILALSSIVTFFSSFLKSVIPIIIIIIGLIIFGFNIIDIFVMTTYPQFEPFYSLSYLSNIIQYSLYPNFSSMERTAPFGWWLFPTIQGALITFSIYSIVFFTIALILFKRKEF